MSYSLNQMFTTITSHPFQNDSGYTELLPCDELKPYIRCFWGTRENYISKHNTRNVIPDMCSDIIITVDLNKNSFDDVYCGICNRSFLSTGEEEHKNKFTFGIRFYAWSAVLFSDCSMRNSLNDYSCSEKYFNKLIHNIKDEIFHSKDIFERKVIAEKILMKHLNFSRENNILQNAFYNIIKANGNISVDTLSTDCYISKRQLERIYSEYIGVSPKQIICLIRYQLLWQNALKKNFDIQTAVEKFGYYDQPHLLKEFKKYHGVSLKNALKLSHFYNT